MKKTILIALAVWCGSVCASAQEPEGIELSGVILSTDQTAVAYATVMAKRSTPPKVSGTISDLEGHFTLGDRRLRTLSSSGV